MFVYELVLYDETSSCIILFFHEFIFSNPDLILSSYQFLFFFQVLFTTYQSNNSLLLQNLSLISLLNIWTQCQFNKDHLIMFFYETILQRKFFLDLSLFRIRKAHYCNLLSIQIFQFQILSSKCIYLYQVINYKIKFSNRINRISAFCIIKCAGIHLATLIIYVSINPRLFW